MRPTPNVLGLSGRSSASRQIDRHRASTRRLFASGRYLNLVVRGVRSGDDVTLIFDGTARYYVGRVTILGVKSERLASLLEFATKLDPGTEFNEPAIPAGVEGIKLGAEECAAILAPAEGLPFITEVAGENRHGVAGIG